MPNPDRQERLARQLRANLKKRKQQERARGVLPEDKQSRERAGATKGEPTSLPDPQQSDEE